MSNVISFLNQLLQAAIRTDLVSTDGPLQPTNIQLSPDGAHVEARIDLTQVQGSVVFDLGVTSPAPEHFVVSLTVVEPPEELASNLEPFRTVLERLEAQITLDFSKIPESRS